MGFSIKSWGFSRLAQVQNFRYSKPSHTVGKNWILALAESSIITFWILLLLSVASEVTQMLQDVPPKNQVFGFFMSLPVQWPSRNLIWTVSQLKCRQEFVSTGPSTNPNHQKNHGSSKRSKPQVIIPVPLESVGPNQVALCVAAPMGMMQWRLLDGRRWPTDRPETWNWNYMTIIHLLRSAWCVRPKIKPYSEGMPPLLVGLMMWQWMWGFKDDQPDLQCCFNFDIQKTTSRFMQTLVKPKIKDEGIEMRRDIWHVRFVSGNPQYSHRSMDSELSVFGKDMVKDAGVWTIFQRCILCIHVIIFSCISDPVCRNLHTLI